MSELPDKPEVEILGVKLYAVDIPSAASLILNGCQQPERNNYCISATGAHGLVFSKQSPQFRSTLQSFFLNLPDGMPGVWIGKIKGAKKMQRCYGPSFFQHMMEHSANLPIKHFFCGGNEGVALLLKEAVKKKFHNDNVVDTYCPPFLSVDKFDYGAIADIINRSGANIVWIGLSTPKQETFALNLAKKTNAHYIITVGAAFDFHTDKVRQAPKFLQTVGLEWFFRLMMEPKRLYRRYLEIVPLFIYYNLKELVIFASQKIFKKKQQL
jgi:N-acetylglucosaminyldiphosphoundecaprenol N-acetyl-beta-D-mannosaminyltransferase